MTRVDAVDLARTLVRIDSRNPTLAPGGPGEMAVAQALAGTLESWGLRVEMYDAAPGRPNVIARAGRGNGRSLMLNGHVDVVGVDGMSHAPFAADERAGKLYGRGAADMKGGIASMCAAAARVAARGIEGEVILAAVADEEHTSLGTRAMLRRGVRADAAIVAEPTSLAIMPAHKGFAWLEVDVKGRASLHASSIEGGEGWSTYPARCVIRVERRTLPGESREQPLTDVRNAIARAATQRPSLAAEARLLFTQDPSDVAADAPIVRELEASLADCGERVAIAGMSAWTDAALLNDAGVPAICFGPGDIARAHAAEEWIDVDEIERAARVLETLIDRWCNGSGG
jgi:acetylornithine deacetylase